MAGCTRHAAPGMSPGSTQIEAGDRHAIVGMTEYWPRAEQLVKAESAMEDVAADQAETSLEIARSKGKPSDH